MPHNLPCQLILYVNKPFYILFKLALLRPKTPQKQIQKGITVKPEDSMKTAPFYTKDKFLNNSCWMYILSINFINLTLYFTYKFHVHFHEFSFNANMWVLKKNLVYCTESLHLCLVFHQRWNIGLPEWKFHPPLEFDKLNPRVKRDGYIRNSLIRTNWYRGGSIYQIVWIAEHILFFTISSSKMWFK